jgi:hypothetical protein
MANLLDMQKILGGIQQQYPVTPPTQPSAPTPTVDPKAGRNQKLAMMLYALGGALKGDEDFVVKTLQLQQVQEGKKKEKEQKEAYDEFLKKLPEGSFKDLTKALGYKKLPELLLKKYEAEQPKPIDPSKAIKQEELMVLQKLKSVGGDMSQLDDYERTIYDNYVKRNPDPQSIISALLNQDIPAEPFEIIEIKK